ncbi:MarR family transcriptional regulator [Leifsonia sp. Leaf264]|uniref:MarR family transcriptional regulator n=1 Tax=Leifsonia sp. Leaf264 TaxID=1736314 RepID=UPI0006F8E182|nr:MarR family transcriptional regulator [Leifsonia sp. Leaf264]KQO96658.1 MarR family transcriptional regulator [Leifsonia sp. Leaf264]
MTIEENGADAAHRRAVTAAKDGLRELRVQLSVLNHQVGLRAGLRDVDLDCLDLISANGPLSPGALARLAGVHPATLTGILDRLEKGLWIARDRDPADRRSVLIRIEPERNREMFRLYTGMNSEMDRLCADYDEDQLEVITGFLRRSAEAGRVATGLFAEE